jgi:hypothetical protein
MEKISTPSAKAIAITFPRPRTGKNNTLPLKTAPISRLNCLNNSLLVPHKLITNKPLLVSKVLHAENRFIPRGRGNVIAIAFADGVDIFSMKALRARARQLDEQYQIEFIDFIKDIKRNNGSVLKRVIKA